MLSGFNDMIKRGNKVKKRQSFLYLIAKYHFNALCQGRELETVKE